MRPGSRRTLNRESTCRHCEAKFACADPKAAVCPTCRGCRFCGKETRSPNRTCGRCYKKNPTDKQKEQLQRLHDSIRGDNNPSKRPEVRAKLSAGKMGDLNPARIHRELFAAHIAKYRPGKVSKPEGIVAGVLPEYVGQHPVRWWQIDLADVDRKIAVEIQGCWHHSCQLCYPGSPHHKTQRHNSGNDQRKHTFLRSEGWAVVKIWTHEIKGLTTAALAYLCQQRIQEQLLIRGR